ncbi:MAG: SusC/RagA family TonB-linked outer membrane protein [Saprospiraceae bacterium]|nr:SusC/RagA family TonB-linked outer membrane protein [Saprospiraceae bacterium]
MKKLSLLLVLLFCSCAIAYAQIQVKGVIKDDEDGSPLVGASIVEKGTSNGTVTDIDGAFTLTVPKGTETVVVSFVGYSAQEIALNGQSTVEVKLKADGNVLGDVVIVGYGSQSKREVSGAISKVKSEDIENLPVQSFDRALQGRAAGVWVTSASGAPGSAVSVRIRGVGSLTAGNEPLYVVDGIQISSTSANNVNNNTTVSNNPLGFINPNDIESIEIIKDAASAAIYGSAAANGVVIVTTKKGKAGKTKFNLNVYRGRTEQFKRLDVLNSQEYIQARAEARRNPLLATGSNPDVVTLDSAKQLVLGEIGRIFRGGQERWWNQGNTNIDTIKTVDWQDAASRTGNIQNYEFSANGGNDKTQFFISASYNQQDANIINIDFTRAAASLRLSNTANDWLRFESNINLSSSKQRGLFGGPGGGAFLGSPAFSAPIVLPMNPIRYSDGSYFGASPTNLAGILNQNVIQVGELNKINSRIDQLVGSFKPIFTINKNLTFTPSVSLDFRKTKSFNFQDPRTPDVFAVSGRITEERGENLNFLSNAVLNYTTKIADKHSISGLAGVEYRKESYEEILTSGTGVASPLFSTLSATAVDETVTGFGTNFIRAGVFGRLQYGFSDKYF